MLKHYLTVKKFAHHELIVEKSRFIASVNRAETNKEGLAFIEEIKASYPDASHHCYAYIIGENDQHQKAYDDGEPSGTAGKPILEMLKKWHLKDTVVVITRYFGGTKLGAGGLIRAYGRATKEGLLHAGLVKRQLNQEVELTIDYSWLGKLQNECYTHGYTIKDTQFQENVKITILVESDKIKHCTTFFTALTNGQATISLGEFTYTEENLKEIIQ